MLLGVRAEFKPQLQHAIVLAAGKRILLSFSGQLGVVVDESCFATVTPVRERQVPFPSGSPIVQLVSIGQRRRFALLVLAVPDFAPRCAAELRTTAFDLQDGFRLVQHETLLHVRAQSHLRRLVLVQ